MVNGKIRLLGDPRPLNRSTQNLQQVITSANRPPVQNFVQIRPFRLLGKGVKYNGFFLFPYTFLMANLQVRPVGGFLRAMAQTMWPHARVCFLRVENLKLISNP